LLRSNDISSPTSFRGSKIGEEVLDSEDEDEGSEKSDDDDNGLLLSGLKWVKMEARPGTSLALVADAESVDSCLLRCLPI
jgi:hypothetical protein